MSAILLNLPAWILLQFIVREQADHILLFYPQCKKRCILMICIECKMLRGGHLGLTTQNRRKDKVGSYCYNVKHYCQYIKAYIYIL